MVAKKVYDLCRSTLTVSSEIAKEPGKAPGKIAKELYGDLEEGLPHENLFKDYSISQDDLERAYQCGNWGETRPSDLFLKIFHDAIRPLEADPLIGMVSPPLMGSCGVNPMTIIGPLPDICRHMSNVIARAEKEVFLATNYWMDSDASHLINQGLIELSKRAGARGTKVVVKIMYDRGNAKQFLNNHQPVPEKEYTTGAVKLPSSSQIPNINLEVVNFHRPIFGTFHAKYMVVDRRIAIISSNNIQDNDNVEMMTHLEGPIVDSFYDLSLNSWHNAFDPPLPMINSPAVSATPPSFEKDTHKGMFDENGAIKDLTGQPLPTVGTDIDRQTNAHATGSLGHGNQESGVQPENANLSKIVELGQQRRLPEHDGDDPHFDQDIAGEVLRAQSVLTPMEGETRMNAVTRHLNAKLGKGTKGTAPECEHGDEMITMIPSPAHDYVPMAMVCRKSHGSPDHKGVRNPQNEAFLSAVRNAERDVFIQTPNLNAEPLLPELIRAAKRGVDVYYYICLGYNDAGELLPRQGGNNEYIANKLLQELNEQEKQHMHIFNYIAKDQITPIHNSKKERSCHIKLLIADGHVGIQGNGNQDTQSWYHSLEANVMIDSATICTAWAEGIRRNQNTHIYGEVSQEDGCWHDNEGRQAAGAIGNTPGKMSWLKGFTGAIARVRGAGGF